MLLLCSSSFVCLDSSIYSDLPSRKGSFDECDMIQNLNEVQFHRMSHSPTHTRMLSSSSIRPSSSPPKRRRNSAVVAFKRLGSQIRDSFHHQREDGPTNGYDHDSLTILPSAESQSYNCGLERGNCSGDSRSKTIVACKQKLAGEKKALESKGGSSWRLRWMPESEIV